MPIELDGDQRQALYRLVVDDLCGAGGLEELARALAAGETALAKALWAQLGRDGRLLDQLGWKAQQQEPNLVLDVPHGELLQMLVYFGEVAAVALQEVTSAEAESAADALLVAGWCRTAIPIVQARTGR